MTAARTLGARLREAEGLWRAGRMAAAAAAYRDILAEHPDLPDCWFNLAQMERFCGNSTAALEAYDQALQHGIQGGEEVRINRGVIYAQDMRDPQQAEREFTAALSLVPDCPPALLNLGNLYEDCGNREGARDCYRRILARDPGNGTALAMLAGLETVSSPDAPLVTQLRQAMAGCSRAAEKTDLGYALGRLLDGCGAYDQAFAAYADANRLGKIGAGAAGFYDRKRHEALIDALIAAFPAGNRQTTGSAPALFICGMFRSGSTLAEQILAACPGVSAGGELPFIPALVRGELAPFPARLAKIAPEKLAQLAEHYRERIAALFPSAVLVTDKLPDNFLYVGLIKRLFPAAKFVHTVRDPLDTCLSVFFQRFDGGAAYAFDFADIAHYYAQYRRLMAHWKTCFGDDILDFDYDAFVHVPEDNARALLDFCGLPWHRECLSFHRLRNQVRTASVWQVREPLYTRASGRWRNYERHLAPLIEALRGYSII